MDGFAAPPPRTPRSRLAAWLVGGAVLVGVLAVAVAVAFVAAMSGGLDDLLDFSNPSEDDRRVVRAGETALRDIAPIGSEIATTVAEAVPALGAVRASGTRNVCDVGQHNIKTDDDYDLRCAAHHVTILVPPSMGVRGDVLAVDSVLIAAGWVPDGYRSGPLRDGGGGQGPVDGQLATYLRGTERLTLTAGDAPDSYWLRRFANEPPLRAPDGSEVPVGELIRSVPIGYYVLLLDVQRTYFEE